MEGVRLRARELTPLFHVHDACKLGDLHEEISDVLDHFVDALEVAGVVLFLTNFDSGKVIISAGIIACINSVCMRICGKISAEVLNQPSSGMFGSYIAGPG